jgi:hypothetical protein
MTSQGGYADYDRFGGVRGSSLSPFPTIQQTYQDYEHDVTVPGRTTSQFGNGAPIVNLTYSPTIQAWDGVDVKRTLDKHASELGASISRGLQGGHMPDLQETLRNL